MKTKEKLTIFPRLIIFFLKAVDFKTAYKLELRLVLSSASVCN